MTAAARPFSVQIITCVAQAWPAMLAPETGLIGRAIASGLIELTVHDLRDYGSGPHRTIDARPYGGGAGMVLMAPPLLAAMATARAAGPGPVLILAPRGPTFTQQRAVRLAAGEGFILVCGRYEGIDERVYDKADGCVSVGDFVLTGGDPAALCVVDAVVRLREGTLGNRDSLLHESFAANGLQYPQYTRPPTVERESVPAVLQSGDHKQIEAWRRAQQRALTAAARPDLLTGVTAAAGEKAGRG